MNLNGYLCYSFFYHHHLSYTRKESKRKTMTIRHNNSSFLSHILVCHKLKVAFESSIHRHGQTAWTGLSTKNRLVLCRQQAGVCVKPRERERERDINTQTHTHTHTEICCAPHSHSHSHTVQNTHTQTKKKKELRQRGFPTQKKRKKHKLWISPSLFFLSFF